MSQGELARKYGFSVKTISIWDLSKILEHHSVETTEKYYAHFNVEHIKTRMQIIERRENMIRANFG